MLIFQLLRKTNFRLEKIIFQPKKCIYFISYRKEHPVYKKKKDIAIAMMQKLIILWRSKGISHFKSPNNLFGEF